MKGWRDEARGMSDDELFRALVDKDGELERPTGDPAVDRETREMQEVLMAEFLDRK
jgi:hypothetical protein